MSKKRETKDDIMTAVAQAIGEVLQGAREEWVTAKTLTERMPMFTESFLKKHGQCLPREKMLYRDGAVVRETAYMYPINAINRMVQRGQFRTPDGTERAFAAWKETMD